MRADPSLVTIPDVPTLAKNYLETKKLIGTKRIAEPQENWKDEDWNGFYKSAGRPETADKYSVPVFKGEDGQPVEMDKEQIAYFTKKFHEAGLSDRQAKALITGYVEQQMGSQKKLTDASNAERLAAEDALKKEYGDAFPAKIELAKSALTKFADDDFTVFLSTSKLGNDPRMVRMLVKIAQGMTEDTAAGKGGTDPILSSKAAALQELDKMKGDQEFNKKRFGGDKFARERWEYVHKLAYPEDKIA